MRLPEDTRLSILRTEAITGTILAQTEDQALLIVQKRGRGEVVFAAFDPGRAPLTAWDGMALLWKMLFRLDDTPNYWKLRRELRETFEETWTSQALQLPLLAFPSHLLLAVFLGLYVGYDRVFLLARRSRQPRCARHLDAHWADTGRLQWWGASSLP